MAGEASHRPSRKEKGKKVAEPEPEVLPMEGAWEPATTTERQIQNLVNAGLLPPKEISKWEVPVKDSPAPVEKSKKVTVFRRYFEVGLGLPTHPFLRGLLCFWGIQAVHLSLNSFLHIAIFIHLCEAFIGIEPHFALFLAYFRLKIILRGGAAKYISGAGLQFKQKMQALYVPYDVKDTYKNWEREWFFVEDLEPSLPPRKPEMPIPHECWNSGKAELGADEVEALLITVTSLREAGLTGAHVFMSFLQRRVQPLQLRKNPAYAFAGKEDPSRLVKEDLSKEEASRIVARYLKETSLTSPGVSEYDAAKSPEEVNFDNLVC